MPLVGVGNRLSALGASQVAAAGSGHAIEGDGFVAWAQAAASPLFVPHPIEAAGSENLTQTLARVANFATHEATYGFKPSHALFHAGRNNMGVDDLEGHMDLVNQIVTALLDQGIMPIITQLIPSVDGSSTAARTWHYNIALSHLARMRNIPYLLMPTGLVDEAAGGLADQYVQVDGVHLNEAGAKFYGTHLGQQLRTWTGARSPWSPVYVYANDSQTVSGSKLLNPLMLDDTNADGIPNSWSASFGTDAASITTQLVDGSTWDIPGNVFKMTKAANAGDSYLTQQLQTPINANSWYAIGYKIWFENNGGSGNRIWIDLTTNTGSQLIRHTYWPDSDWMSGNDPAQFWIVKQLPSSITSLNFRIINTALGTLYFAQPTVVDLTAAGIDAYK